MATCEVHKYHWPPPLGLVTHHIQPLGMGGPDTPENKITVCDTGHRNIHRILDAFFRGVPAKTLGTKKEYAYAEQGYDMWVQAGEPGHPTYEVGEP